MIDALHAPPAAPATATAPVRRSAMRKEDRMLMSEDDDPLGLIRPGPACPCKSGACHDCGRRYGDEYGFPDLIVDDEVWSVLAPPEHEDGSGLLCPSCMCRRGHEVGFESMEARFTSGPFASTTEPSGCPDCGGSGEVEPSECVCPPGVECEGYCMKPCPECACPECKGTRLVPSRFSPSQYVDCPSCSVRKLPEGGSDE